MLIYFTFKYRFWSKQPVFHSYNIWYWLFPPGIIEHSSPKLGKFFDRSIITKNYKDLNSSQKSDIYRLIYSHYLQEKNIKTKKIFKWLKKNTKHIRAFKLSSKYKNIIYFVIADLTYKLKEIANSCSTCNCTFSFYVHVLLFLIHVFGISTLVLAKF